MKKLFLLVISGLLTVTIYASKIDTVAIYCNSMHKIVKACVITPHGYPDGVRNYPVVYLLHGYSGNYKSWVDDFPVTASLSDRYNVIIVSPDGGFSSWYLDSPKDSSYRYETFVSRELVTYIDEKFHSLKDKKGRAISGLSMGGHGALYLALKHPDVFGAVGSMSGGVDILPFPNNWDISKRLGPQDTNKKLWVQNSVVNLIPLALHSELAMIIDCGTDDFFIDVNRDLHKKMLELKIPHDYTERPGAHNSEYWNNSILYHMLFFDNFFKK